MRNQAIQKLKESVDIPVIAAPLFLIDNPKMTINTCASGVIGTFPALNARTEEILDEWMNEITTELSRLKLENPNKKIAPWGINFITHRTNKRYKEDLRLIEKYQPPLVITSLGDPGPVVKIVHEYGGVVLSDVIDIKYAKKAIEKGSDGLILVASGAGGHGGTYNPIPFVHEVRKFFDGPIALSGGLTNGEDILVAELLGADFAYMGTRFIPTKESSAHSDYKKMIIDSSIEDVFYTNAFTGIDANYLIPSMTRMGLSPEQIKRKDRITLMSALKSREVKPWKHVWGAGHGVGSINKIQTVSEVVEELKESYNLAIEKISEKSRVNVKN